MPYMLVDDLLSGHPKARRVGLEAMGLWTVAGSQVSLQLSDGVVPRWYVESWPKGEILAQRLVEAELWHESGHDCPDCPQPPAGEWIFHQWLDRNPSREKVLAKRAARKAAGQRGGLAKAQAKATANGVATATASARGVAKSHGRTPSPSPSSTSVVTLVALLTKADPRVTTTTIETWATRHTPGVDLETETARFLTVNAGKDLHDVRAAWQAWMRKARPARERVTVPAKAGSADRATIRPDDPRCPHPGHETELATNCRICAADRLASDPTTPDTETATP